MTIYLCRWGWLFHVVLMNAEIDATIGPILQVYAAKYGAILSACDGDEPGVQMNLYRWVKGLGLTPRFGPLQEVDVVNRH